MQWPRVCQTAGFESPLCPNPQKSPRKVFRGSKSGLETKVDLIFSGIPCKSLLLIASESVLNDGNENDSRCERPCEPPPFSFSPCLFFLFYFSSHVLVHVRFIAFCDHLSFFCTRKLLFFPLSYRTEPVRSVPNHIRTSLARLSREKRHEKNCYNYTDTYVYPLPE